MTATFQEALRLLFIVCFTMGLGIYPVQQAKPKIRWIIYFYILYSLTIWLVYGCILCCAIRYFKVIFASITEMVMILIIFITTITSSIINLYRQKKIGPCMKKLTVVDDILEELGTPKMYSKSHMLSKIMVIGWIVHYLIINFYNIVTWINEGIRTTYITFILNHVFYTNTLMDLLFVHLLWYIGTRYDKVNEHMRCLLVKKENWLRCTWNTPLPVLWSSNYKRTLWTSMHLHLELCRITREVNLIFGTQLTLLMAVYFLILTTMCYFLCFTLIQTYERKVEIFAVYGVLVWFVTLLMKISIINHIIESVKAKANNVDKIIHQLTNILRYTDIYTEIYQFILQIMQQPLRFTGIGLFTFGNEFIRKVYVTILMYVIIMVQMNIRVPNVLSTESNNTNSFSNLSS